MGGKQAKQRNSLINRESYSSSDSSNKIVSVDFRVIGNLILEMETMVC